MLAAFEYLRSARIVGIHDLVPAYSTLLVHFSPEEVDGESLRQYLENILLRANGVDVLVNLAKVNGNTLQYDLVGFDQVVLQVGVAQVE